jgi:hypothetical protein
VVVSAAGLPSWVRFRPKAPEHVSLAAEFLLGLSALKVSISRGRVLGVRLTLGNHPQIPARPRQARAATLFDRHGLTSLFAVAGKYVPALLVLALIAYARSVIGAGAPCSLPRRPQCGRWFSRDEYTRFTRPNLTEPDA